MMSRFAPHIRTGVTGLALGFTLSRVGFSSYKEVHEMFSLLDFRLLFTFGAAVGMLAVAYLILKKVQKSFPPSKSFHPGIVPGGILFGFGWALTGACPAIPLVQLGEGQIPAVASLAGIIIGTVAYRKLHERFFRWKVVECGE